MSKRTFNTIGLIVGVVGLLSFQTWWYLSSDKQAKEAKTNTKTIVLPGDSFAYEVKVAVPMPYKVVSIDTFWRDRPIDTMAILCDYFTQRFYNDTIKDSTVIAIFKETVERNRITSRKVWFQNLREKAIITNTTIIEQPPKLLIGVSAGVFNKSIGIGGVISYQRQYDAFMLNVTNQGIQAGYLLKLK